MAQPLPINLQLEIIVTPMQKIVEPLYQPNKRYEKRTFFKGYGFFTFHDLLTGNPDMGNVLSNPNHRVSKRHNYRITIGASKS